MQILILWAIFWQIFDPPSFYTPCSEHIFGGTSHFNKFFIFHKFYYKKQDCNSWLNSEKFGKILVRMKALVCDYFGIFSIFPQCSKSRKKCNFKCTKTHFLLFQKWQKINFCWRKKFKNTKNPVFFFSPKIAFLVVLNFVLVQKMIFCHFWNSKKCVFVLLKLHFFQF